MTVPQALNRAGALPTTWLVASHIENHKNFNTLLPSTRHPYYYRRGVAERIGIGAVERAA
jgi:hypothetical protein